MHKVNLGELIKDGQAANRDAIHIAVAPVVAGERLCPGEHIFIAEANGKAFKASFESSIGIVDPFINCNLIIESDETFWLLLKPNSITDLRHHWSHPAFKDDIIDANKLVHMEWIKNYAESINTTYDELMAATELWISNNDYFNKGDVFDGVELDELFWGHYEVVKGVKLDEDKKVSFFSCAC